MEDTKLVVCRLCLGFTTSDDSQIVDSPLKKILQDILPEINLEISYDPKICQPCNKSVLKCYEFKSSCSRDSIKEEIQAEEAAADLVIETDLQQEKKCDFCFSKINEKAFVEFSVRKEFFNEVLQKCLPGWFQKITKQKSAVPCGTCLDDLKSHFLFIGACLTTEEKIRKYCTTYGTNSKDKVNLFEVAQADLNPIQEYSAESKMGETIVPLKVEPIDIKHEIYEGDFIGHASTNQSDQLTASDGADDLAMVTDDQGPEKCESQRVELHTQKKLHLKPAKGKEKRDTVTNLQANVTASPSQDKVLRSQSDAILYTYDNRVTSLRREGQLEEEHIYANSNGSFKGNPKGALILLPTGETKLSELPETQPSCDQSCRVETTLLSASRCAVASTSSTCQIESIISRSTAIEMESQLSDSDSQDSNGDDSHNMPVLLENLPESPEIKRPRKRPANPAAWRQNIIKRCRNSGLPYTSNSKSKKAFGARKLGPPCGDRCRIKCSLKISDEDRKTLFSDYWGLGDLQRQRDFIWNSTEQITPKYRYIKEDSTRSANNAFYFTLREKRYRVCKAFFKSTLGISDRPIRTVFQKKAKFNGGVIPADMRGRHGNHHQAIGIKRSIPLHIQSLPRVQSHGRQGDSPQEYTGGHKSVADLHRDYVRRCKDKNEPYANYLMYSRVFNDEFKR